MAKMERMDRNFDGLTFVAVALVIFMLTRILGDRRQAYARAEAAPPATATAAAPLPTAVEVIPTVDPASFISPYDTYTLTQGPHGASYGQNAIDISAGNGTPIMAPISGMVTALYLDEVGNPTLVLENEVYQVTLLHGIYTVVMGQFVQQGDLIGTESNLGNTKDMSGRSCAGRDCGYHTHLNVFDKRQGINLNPIDLLPHYP